MNRYDAVVIGAGPAGAMAAREAARRGARVLLVEKQRFPRFKPCGCCVNGAAIKALSDAGLSSLTRGLHARPLQTLRLASGRQRVEILLPTTVCVSREAFDAALVQAAVDAGVEFRSGVAARVGEPEARGRKVHIGDETVEAGSVIVAAGLGARVEVEKNILETPDDPRHTRIGLATATPAAPSPYAPGVIHMACGRAGYVGLVVLEDGRLNIAAALDPDFIRTSGGPAHAVGRVLHGCGFPPIEDLHHADWRGTPRLMRQRRVVAAERLFFVGDAAGYLEPITGEGIAWALAGGRAVAELAAHPWEPAMIEAWTEKIASLRRGQRICRIVAAALRRPWITRAAIAACAAWPGLAHPVMRRINRPLLVESRATGGAVHPTQAPEWGGHA